MHIIIQMLPADVVRHIASYLPSTHARIVEPVWNPKLGDAFYISLARRETHTRILHGARTGIEYHLYTQWCGNKFVTRMFKDGEDTGCACYHGKQWETAQDASNWLIHVMYPGHRRGPRINLFERVP